MKLVKLDLCCKFGPYPVNDSISFKILYIVHALETFFPLSIGLYNETPKVRITNHSKILILLKIGCRRPWSTPLSYHGSVYYGLPQMPQELLQSIQGW